MLNPSSLGVYICIFALPIFSNGQTTNNSTQVDLIFPRNNTSYAPVWPFPIVIAYHNYRWHLDDFRISWKPFQDHDEEGTTWNNETVPLQNLIDSATAKLGNQSVPSYDEEYQQDGLYIRAMSLTGRTSEPRANITGSYNLTITFTNTKLSTEDPGKFILFNISSNGQLPEIAQQGPCALPIGAFCLPNGFPCPPESCLTYDWTQLPEETAKDMLLMTSCQATNRSGSLPGGLYDSDALLDRCISCPGEEANGLFCPDLETCVAN